MLVPIKWLYELVPCNKSAKALAELFTEKGIETANIKRVGEKLDGFIVVQISKIENNKLVISDGKKDHNITAVAYHLKASDKIGYNPNNSKLINPELLEISEDTLPYILNKEYQTGSSVLDYLDDYVLDLEILPNRGDLMSIIGIARELASYEPSPCTQERGEEISSSFKLGEIAFKESDKYNIADELKLDIINKDGCPDYIARIICDIKIAPSPFWLQWRLMAVGLRPINNIVDATNYIMVKYGTPLHAFDYDKIIGKNVQVRFAKKGEKIKTIDNTVRDLNEQVLLIADKKFPIAIAGIMGGSDTEIGLSTKKVILECARFDSKVIRKGSKKINLSTEASQRFEMGIDANILETASKEASYLMADLGRGEVAKGILESRTAVQPIEIEISQIKINQLLGVNLENGWIKKTLSRLNCQVSEKDNKYIVSIPSYRLDLTRDVDLIEELGRIYGYGKLPSNFSLRGGVPGAFDQLTRDIQKIREYFIGAGFIESYTISFCDEKTALEFSDGQIIRIPNPLNERYSVLRPSILATLLDSVKINYSRGNKNLRLFEIGKIFSLASSPRFGEAGDKKETIYLAAVLTGQTAPIYWKHTNIADFDFFDIKGLVESFLVKFKIHDINFEETNVKYLSNSNSIAIKYADKIIGYIGQISKPISEQYDIPVSVYSIELNLEEIIKLMPSYRYFQPLPRYPSVVRDFAFIVNDKVSTAKMIQTIEKIAGALVETVEVFDYFKGKPLPEGKRNLGIRITLRSLERTLNQEEVNKLFERIVKFLKDKMQVELRSEASAEQ